MTLSTTTVSQSYSGNGSTTAFTFTFPINSTSELKVIERSATGAETVKSEGTGSANYSIVDNGASGGTVTMVTAPASGTTLVLIRDTSLTQESDYVENDPFAAETHEDALDKLQMQIQEVQEEVDRSMKLSRTNTMTSTEFTNSATDRASKVLAFDSSGELSVTQELGTFKGDSATTTTAAYVIRDIVKSTTTAQLNNIYICIQASPIGTALTNTSYWTLIVDAVSAATSATTATTKASEAATSATNAAASYDSFDDRYLGAKSSDPSADNDGDGLLTGAIYFKTDGTGFKVYNGSAWKDIRPTDAQQTNIDTVAGANSNISALAASAVIADMALLATTDVIADMALLATSDVISDMNTLATSDIVSDINTLATSDIVSDLNTLATSDIVSDINTLATSDIVSDLNTLATSDFVSDLNTLAVSSVISDMNTLAGSGNAPNVTNVTASGTMQFGSLSDGTITITDFVDEDNMASNSAVKIPTQQSVKAYVDSQTAGSLSLIDEDNMATDSATRPPSQQSVKAFAESLTGTNIVATGALNAGSITSGFGNIDTGASTITTTGAVATGALSVTGASTITTADNTDTLSLISTDADAAVGPVLNLYRNSSSPATDDVLGAIKFSGENSADEVVEYFRLEAAIQDKTDGSEDFNFKFKGLVNGAEKSFFEGSSGTLVFNNDSVDMDFRVESNGNANMLFVDGGNDNVSIGTSAVVQDFGSDRTHLTIRSASSGNYSVLAISGHADSNDQIHGLINFYNETTSVARISSLQESNTSDAYLNFFTAPSSGGIAERMRIHGGGVVSIPNGIALGVGTANTASNVLDDYEEGTFTMGMADASGNALTMNGTYAVMHYTKIGNMVHINGLPVVSSIASAGSDVRITGLPFTSKNHATNYSTLAIGYASSLSIPDDTVITSYVNQNSTIAPMRIWTNTSGTDQLSASQLSDGAEFVISGTYIVA